MSDQHPTPEEMEIHRRKMMNMPDFSELTNAQLRERLERLEE